MQFFLFGLKKLLIKFEKFLLVKFVEVITSRKALHFFFCISVTCRPLLRRE